MSFDPIDLIKNIPPSARRVLEVSEAPTALTEISRARAPQASIVVVAPAASDAQALGTGDFDCVALFSGGLNTATLARLFENLPARAQILAAPDAMGPELTDALAKAGCHVFATEPVLRAWHAREAPPAVLLHCMIPLQSAEDAQVRIHHPNGFLRTIPGLRPLAEIESFSPSLAMDHEARILLMHRAVPKRDRDLEFLKRAVAENYLIVLDIDDDPESFRGLHDDDAFALRCLHAAQVSTPEIAVRLREQVSPVAVFANQIGFLPAPRVPMEGPVRVFLGAYNRRDDWAEIIELANRVLGYFQDRVAVEVVHDRSVFDALQVPNKRFTPRCSHQAYLQLLASCDIALMPLRDTPFNRCKSDLKFIECAAHGVVSLAPMTVYAATLADGRTGVLYRSSVEFMVGLQRLIQEVDLRTRIAGAGRKYVADQRMQADHYEARHAWYLELIAKADDLRTSHRRRMPDLYG